MAHAACPERHSLDVERPSLRPFAWLARLAARFAAAWRASDEAEIRLTLARSGGRLTDSMERELMDRTLNRWRGWN